LKNRRTKLALRAFLVMWISALSLAVHAQPAHVELKKSPEGNFRLYKNGEPFYIRGGGGTTEWEQLANMGGNSVRTWSTDDARQMLDKAQDLGLMVMMGMWMQHERHGFDYDDKAKVKAQLEHFKKTVLELKDHPALLMWGVGNEVDLFYTNTNVWFAVEDIAKMIHELDPHHPTCTVTAGLDSNEVQLIKSRAPSIDIYGVNTYGDIAQVRQKIQSYGWDGAYAITEWGPNGHWEVAKTKWGAPIEQTSSEKAISYRNRYDQEIQRASKYCIGSYAFLWGFKQETTSTWYGLFSPSGNRSEAIDELQLFWTGRYPENRAPQVQNLMCNNMLVSNSVMLEAGMSYPLSIVVDDPDADALKASWKLVPESTDIKAGGDAESAPEPIPGMIRRRELESATLRAPQQEGAYRIFYEVQDGHGHYAYANFPVYVMPSQGQTRTVQFIQQSMTE
jgi:hypothetical protein